MDRKLVFDIKIDMIGESIQLKSDNGGVSMIPLSLIHI